MFPHPVADQAVLKPLALHDAEAIFAAVEKNRKYLTPWLPWVRTTQTSDNVRDFVADSMRGFRQGTAMRVGIWADDKMVGVAALEEVNKINRLANLGYWVGENWQGKGIATDSCRFLINYAFEKLGLNRVEIACAVDNDRSRKLAERLGMTLEGTRREAEWFEKKVIDHVVYSLLRREWK